MKQRKINQIRTPHLHQGFLGHGHLAATVIDGNTFIQSDPFILLMDDRLDLPGGPPVGGPHPHAGFETVTLVLKGDEKDWKTGSFELMTAGKGIIHTEEITESTQMRILQLWLALPPEKRWATPFFQQMLLEDTPVLQQAGREIRVYSGSSNGLSSPLRNHTPLTIADFRLDARAEARQELPASYNGFIYVIEGAVSAGDTSVKKDQVAWLDAPSGTGDSEISFLAGSEGARFVLYAGQPHGAPIVSHGPFIGNNREDILWLYQEYHQGHLPHLNDLPAERKIRHRREEELTKPPSASIFRRDSRHNSPIHTPAPPAVRPPVPMRDGKKKQ